MPEAFLGLFSGDNTGKMLVTSLAIELAGSRIAGLQAGRSAAMRCADEPWVKLSGTTPPCDLLLERVVADRFGRAHAFLEVARLEDRCPARRARWRPTRRHSNRPEARRRPGSRLPSAWPSPRLRLLRLVERALEVLDVVADFVGDHIEPAAKSPGAWKRRDKLVEEIRVDVDRLVGRAVERPHRRLAHAAARSAFRCE